MNSQPHPTAKEEASTPLPGHIFSRFLTFPATGEVTFSVAEDKRDGLGRPGRTGAVFNSSIKDPLRFQISPDGFNFSNEIWVPAFGAGFPNFMEIRYDDGILIHTIRLLGVSGEAYRIVFMPGRSPEGFIPQFAPGMDEPGPQRKISKSKLK